MGEKMEYAVASAAASATIKTVKTVNWIRARKAARIIFSVALAMTVICAFTVVAFAETNAPSTDGGGEKVAESMITEIKKWVGIIAGVVIVFGAVNAGLGVANQDEAGRNRGFMTMAGGAIMEAVVQLV